MDVGHERKRGSKHNSKVFGLGNWMNGSVIYRAGKTMKEQVWGENQEFVFYYSHLEMPFGHPRREVINRQ